MILCVTLNPCLDKTLVVPPWKPGDSVRGTALREVVGGKGNNVARALGRLGRTARPLTFLGGTIGGYCEKLLRNDDQLDPVIIPTASETRVILTARVDHTAEQTAFFDPDPVVSPEEADALLRAVEQQLNAGGVEAIALSGSSPSESTHGLYSDIIALGRAKRVPVFLDTYGPALDAIWGFWPQVVQLNRREAAAHLHRPNPTDAELAGLLDKWAKHGVQIGVITNGAEPALVRIASGLRKVVPPKIEVVNPIGSGDCLLAGLIYAWLAGYDVEAIVREGFACAGANALVWDAGAVDPETVANLREAVVVETAGR